MSTESEETEVEAPAEAQIDDEATSPEEAGSEEVEVSGDTAEEDLEGDVVEGETPEPEADDPARSEQAQEQAGTPFSFRVSGRDVSVDGAGYYEHEDADGNPTASVVIPRDSWNRNVQPYLSDQSATAKRENELRQQIETLDPAKNETVVRAQALLDNFEDIISSEESLTEFLTNFDQNKELLKLKADLAARDATDGVRRSREEQQTNAQREAEVYEQIDTDISTSATSVLDQLNLDISDETKRVIGEDLWNDRHAFYRYATEEDARLYGVTAGEVVCDTDRIAARIHSLTRAAHAGLGRTTKTEQARKTNKAVLDPKDPPATVPASGSPAPGKKVKTYASKEEYEDDMGLN